MRFDEFVVGQQIHCPDPEHSVHTVKEVNADGVEFTDGTGISRVSSFARGMHVVQPNSPYTVYAVVAVKNPKSTLIEPEKMYSLWRSQNAAEEFVDDYYSMNADDLRIVPWVVN